MSFTLFLHSSWLGGWLRIDLFYVRKLQSYKGGTRCESKVAKGYRVDTTNIENLEIWFFVYQEIALNLNHSQFFLPDRLPVPHTLRWICTSWEETLLISGPKKKMYICSWERFYTRIGNIVPTLFIYFKREPVFFRHPNYYRNGLLLQITKPNQQYTISWHDMWTFHPSIDIPYILVKLARDLTRPKTPNGGLVRKTLYFRGA